MTDKQDAARDVFSLPGWQILEATGADAATFLQAQTMNDLRPLAAGRWQWNGWLNPKGRLIALFMLAMIGPQHFWLVAPDFQAEALAERLRRFVFRSKVKLLTRTDLGAVGCFAAPAQAGGDAFVFTRESDGEWAEFDLGGEGGARRLVFCRRASATMPASEITAAEGATASDGEAQNWLAFDIAHGLPRLSMAQSEQWTPQMLSLERLHAFSLKKGCYPGQEIVARTHFLGKAKRELVRVQGTTLTEGADIVVDGHVLGSIVSSAGDEALAVLTAERPDQGWHCGGAACHERPLCRLSRASA